MNRTVRGLLWTGCALGGTIILGIIVFIVLVVIGVRDWHASEPYRDAMKVARNDPRVAEIIGTPIQDGYVYEGSYQEKQGKFTLADVTFQLVGPKGRVSLHVSGLHTDRWRYGTMDVSHGHLIIDLLRPPEGPPPPVELLPEPPS